MSYLIGADEAGYGPNLGPLVVSATAWKTDSCLSETDLYESLAEVVTAGSSRGKSDERIAIADSKVLYKPRGTLRMLERGLLPMLAQSGQPVADWSGLWDALGADPHGAREELPWYRDFQSELPIDLAAVECSELSQRLGCCFDSSGVRPLAIRSRAVFPAEFNALVEEQGSKGAVLSRITIGLVAELLETACTSRDEPVLVVCDKHGGRNRYGEILQRQFPDTLIEICGEGRQRSTYRWGPAEARTEMQFRVGGESFLPAALASMTSKYLREISMRAFNAYWQQEVDDLKPTAGYPVDARRFREDIAEQQIKLKIPDRALWRTR